MGLEKAGDDKEDRLTNNRGCFTCYRKYFNEIVRLQRYIIEEADNTELRLNNEVRVI